MTPVIGALTSLSESKDRNKLRREDAVQRTTISLESPFADTQAQHTGEFHDCIALPIIDTGAFSFKGNKLPDSEDLRNGSVELGAEKSSGERMDKESRDVGQILGKILAASGTKLAGPSGLGQFIDVVVMPGESETMLQSRYLNFITSVEDVASDFIDSPRVIPNSPRGVIIEEITSLDGDNKGKLSETVSDNEKERRRSEEDLAKGTTTREDTLSAELCPESSEAKTNDLASKIAGTTTGQGSDPKTESCPESRESLSEGAGKSGGSMDESFARARLVEGGSDKAEEGAGKEERPSLSKASLCSTEGTISMNIEEILDLGEEEEKGGSRGTNRLIQRALGSMGVSQESRLPEDGSAEEGKDGRCRGSTS
jgi:hypothetical protein